MKYHVPSNMDGFHLYYGPVFTNDLSAIKMQSSEKRLNFAAISLNASF